MPPATPEAVIWDVDGTLVDTSELHFHAWDRLAGELGFPFTRAAFEATFGRRNPEILHEMFGPRSQGQEDALGGRKEEYYRAAARAAGVELLPGARSLLGALHAAGFRQALGSSAPRENLELILQLTRTAEFFQAVVAMEDTQRGKPDPQVFLLAAGRLAAPPERCVVVEDAVAGVQAARAGGMKCIAVLQGGHHPAEALRAAGATLVMRSLEEVTVETVRSLGCPA